LVCSEGARGSRQVGWRGFQSSSSAAEKQSGRAPGSSISTRFIPGFSPLQRDDDGDEAMIQRSQVRAVLESDSSYFTHCRTAWMTA
jgi:hypothetical protein